LALPGVAAAEALPIEVGDTWRFFKGLSEPPVDWTGATFDDSAWLEGASGFGYGDGDDATVLADMSGSYSSVYLRRLFDVGNPSTVEQLLLTVDYDDGFVAYLNGQEVARSGVSGAPPAFDARASNHEAGTAETFELGAFLPNLVAGTNVLAIQGHNAGVNSSDFSLIPSLEAITRCTGDADCDDGVACTDDSCNAGTCANEPSCPPGQNCDVETGACEIGPTTVSFQQGVAGYDGSVDTYLSASRGTTDYSTATTLVVDLGPSAKQIAIRFEGLFGLAAGQVPPGSTIESATLTMLVSNRSGAGATLHRLLRTWSDTDTFDDWGGGIQADDAEAMAAPDLVLGGSGSGPHDLDVTVSLQAWSLDPAGNHGWAWLPPSSDDSWQFDSAEGASPPLLTVSYTAPVPDDPCLVDADCDDADACNGDETCVGGFCNFGLPLECDDGNDCTDDACDPALGCSNTPNSAPCDDGTACTVGDQCAAGACTPGPPADCDDGLPCTIDSCDPALGCLNEDACPAGEACDSATGTCEAAAPAEPLPIAVGDSWRYLKGLSEPPADWTSLLFDASSWDEGASGFGFGDGDDTTVLSDMSGSYSSLYLRRPFHVANPSAIGQLILSVDYDDGFVAYLNGQEVARANVSGSPPPFDVRAQNHEAGTPEGFDLGAFLSLLVPGTNLLAIQGHNAGVSSSDFSLIPSLEAVTVCTGPADCDDGIPCTDDACVAGTCESASACPPGQACDPLSGTCETGPTVASFQQRIADYAGTVDTHLRAANPTTDYSTSTPLVVDLGPSVRQALMRFEGLFGTAAGQIPSGATIEGATLTLHVSNRSGAGATLHRLLRTWNDTDTWDDWGDGVQADDLEAVAQPDLSVAGSPTGLVDLDVTVSLQAWADAPPSNHGWVWLPPGSDDSWQFASSEGTTPPLLTVSYLPPVPDEPCLSDSECDDADTCNGDETCVGGFCHAGVAPDCDDGNPCTDDDCDPILGCLNVANTAACDDGDACTVGDQCEGAVCLPGPVAVCDDGLSCTDDSCDPALGCVNVDGCPPGESCDPASGTCQAAPAAAPLPIEVGDLWRYFKGVSEPPADWTAVSFDDSGWLEGQSGFGYGDNDDATVLADMGGNYLSLYARRLFHVSSPATVGYLALGVDYDDGFVAYLNGHEVARSNVDGSPPLHDTDAGSHEAGVSEVFDLTSGIPLLVAGTNVLAIQGHNGSLSSSDFSLIPTLDSDAAPPAEPAMPEPADGATAIDSNPDLCVTATDADGDDVEVVFHGREFTGAEAEDFTIVVLPDTQHYTELYPEIFTAQTQWIVDNMSELNIAYVAHVGDCVQIPTDTLEWTRADSSMSLLDPPEDTERLPFGMAVGNHDQDPFGDPGVLGDGGSTTVLFNETFGVDRFQGRSYHGGTFEEGNNDNHYDLFSAGGMDFVVIYFEYDSRSSSALRDSVLDWADAVLTEHADRRAILVSHHFLSSDLSHSTQGSETYERLKSHPNLFLMLAGHQCYSGRRADLHEGRTVHTLRCDFQCANNGGDGFLRVMRFSPSSNSVRVETYSPTRNELRFDTGPESDPESHHFSLSYDMDGGLPFEEIGRVTVGSGERACVNWPGRLPGRRYQWLAVASDGRFETAGPRWTFSSDGNCSVDTDCEDGSPCTLDDCDPSTFTCTSTPIAGCCVTDSDCDDGDACTDAVCDAGTCVIDYNTAPCDDGDDCTDGDACDLGRCLGELDPDCCRSDAACDDLDGCTADTCAPANRAALALDGFGAHAATAPGAVPGSEVFTVECWLRWNGGGAAMSTGTGGLDAALPLVTRGSDEGDGSLRDLNWFLGIDSATRTLAADLESFESGANRPVLGTTPVSTGAWHHAAATWDGSCWRLYLDGELDAESCGATTARFDGMQPVGLGAALSSTGVPSGAFGGSLDEVRVWDRARSQSEIQADRLQALAPQSGLVARWALDEALGASAADSAGGSRHASLATGASWRTSLLLDFGPTACHFEPIIGCCAADSDCDDGDACTDDACVAGTCETVPFVDCCAADADCDDADTCTDDSCTVDGTCENVPEIGCQDNALSFDGAGDSLDFGPPAAQAPLGLAQFTVECWFRRNGAGVTVASGPAASSTAGEGVVGVPLVAKGREGSEAAGEDVNYFLAVADDAGSVLAADFEASAGTVHAALLGTTPIALGSWHHAALTHDGQVARLYLDGVEEASRLVAADPSALDSGRFSVATTLDAAGVAAGFFHGDVDEVRVWSRALDRSELLDGLNARIASAPDLVGRWGFDEGSGTTAADSSGSTVTATLVGDTAWIARGGAALSGANADCLPGDLYPHDGDGRVDLRDLVLAQRRIAGTAPVSETDLPCGDLHPGAIACDANVAPLTWCPGGDGRFDSRDAEAIRRLALGITRAACSTCESARGVPDELRLGGDIAPRGEPDGLLAVGDVLLALRWAVASTEEPNERELVRVDVSPSRRSGDADIILGDGVVDVNDVVRLLRAAVGLTRLEWPERELRLQVGAAAGPVVAVSVRVGNWPPWARSTGFSVEGPCRDQGEVSFDAAGDAWGLTCTLDPLRLASPVESIVLRYRGAERFDPAGLDVVGRAVTPELELLPVPIGVGGR
jgi:hypothetical protein